MIFTPFVILIIFKIANYSHFKDIFTLYFHFDEWILNFLKLKIQMYTEISARDLVKSFYSIKPVWIVDKESVKDKFYEKMWNDFFSKKKIKMQIQKRFEMAVEKRKDQYDKRFQNIEKSIFDNYQKLKYLKKKLHMSKVINYKKDIKYWDFARSQREKTLKYNWFESLSHKNIISKKYFIFSHSNYYKFNKLLDQLTIKKEVYKQAFAHKYKKATPLMLKKKELLNYIYKPFSSKVLITFFDKILYKIKINKINIKKAQFLNNKEQPKHSVKYESFILKKIYNYLIGKKNITRYKYKEFTIEKPLKKADAKISVKSINLKIDILKKSKKKILNNDRFLYTKGTALLTFPEYVERDKMEKIDNKLLLKTLQKYEKEKTAINKKHKKREPSFILKKKEKSGLDSGSSRK